MTKFMGGGAINCYDSGCGVYSTSNILGIGSGAQRHYKYWNNWFAHCYAIFNGGAFDSCRAGGINLTINRPLSEYEVLGSTATKPNAKPDPVVIKGLK